MRGRWPIHTVIGVVALCAFVLIAGWSYQRIGEAMDNRNYPPPGRLLDVNGRFTHIDCRGSGSPTVLIEQGIGGQALAWNEIHGRMGEITRTCAYDRAGMGYSEPAHVPTLSAEVASSLEALLQAARISDDLVFVGWSAGGMYAREYYRQFPHRVNGMVLVDSAHEQQSARMPPPDNQANLDRLKRNHYLTQVGWIRLSRQIERQFESSPLPLGDRRRLTAIFKKSHIYQALWNEGVGFEHDLAKLQRPPQLSDIPLIVLVEGKPNNAFMQEHLKTWHMLQSELAALSTNSRIVIAHHSAHAIHRTEPELILEAVREVVGAVRNGSRIRRQGAQ